ncbi:MAG: YjbH domain-containing protein, partial [Thiohalomonadales bacterium]
STQQWREDASVQAGLRRALESQGFKNVSLAMQQSQLQLGIATARISLIGRAVGRAVRTALLMAPQGVQSIQVNYYTLSDLPVVSYQFDDLIQLENFFAGKVTYGQLLQSLTVRYISPQDVVSLETVVPPIASRDAAEPTPRPENAFKLEKNSDGHMISLTKTDQSLNSFLFTPVQIGLFFNDPSGAIKYDWFAKASYQHYFDRGWFLNTAARLTISENVSDVVQLSNSTLPHVRTDVAEYKRSKGVKLDNLTLNKYHQLGARLYARWSLGYYEEMFAGTGGQILYMPKTYPWAIDTSVDWLRQRDFDGGFTLQDYETVTALVNFHYRFQGVGVTLTARAGRFLAKDKGVRFEFARRFRSGFMLGAWYTRTDGEDITGPGSPGSPYFDKGIFIQIPLGSMLTRDSRAAPFASLSPWTRDVGQRVQAPSDLYTIMEETLLFDRPEHHLLTGFHD